MMNVVFHERTFHSNLKLWSKLPLHGSCEKKRVLSGAFFLEPVLVGCGSGYRYIQLLASLFDRLGKVRKPVGTGILKGRVKEHFKVEKLPTDLG